MAGFWPPDDITAVPVLPTAAAVGTPGYFTEGSLTSSATIVSQDFLNGIVVEMQNLAAVALGQTPYPTSGPIALSKTVCSLVPNIIALVQAQLGGFVRKIGDVMTGNLTLGTNYGTTNNTPSLVVQSGGTSINFVMNAAAGAFNTAVQNSDSLIYFTDGTQNTGALTIGPWGTGGGIRLDSTGAATFTRPVTVNATLTLLGQSTALTPGINSNNTFLATTAFVAGQAGTIAPLMDSTATVGSSIQFSRQDHVHPSDASRVQQGGGIGQNNNKVYLGWSASGLKLTVDSTDLGVFGMLSQSQSWAGTNNFAGVNANNVVATAYDPTGGGQFRANFGGNSFTIRNDGGNSYLLLGSTTQNFNSLRPLWINNSTGQVNIAGNGQNTWIGGTLQVIGPVNASGTVTANGAYVRAAYGASNNPGDPNLCPILNDFRKYLGAGPYGYQCIAGGMIIQWGMVFFPPGSGVNFNFPIAFPGGYVCHVSITPMNAVGQWSNPPSVRTLASWYCSMDTSPTDDVGNCMVMVLGY